MKIKTFAKMAGVVGGLMLNHLVLAKTEAPFIVGNSDRDKQVTQQQWQRVEALSDEFTTGRLDLNKWNNGGVVPGKFNWLGRYPGLFEKENVHVTQGELWLEAEKFAHPKADERNSRDDWTHGGAIIRSKNMASHGMYIEAKMKTTDTLMSGTFWLMMPASDCNTSIKKELDITESIGRRTGVFKPLKPGQDPKSVAWYEPTSYEFEYGINPTARQRRTSCYKAKNVQTKDPNNTHFDPSLAFHVYGLYWKSPTELYFYVDGEYQFEIIPSTPFDDPMVIIMALETYDFNYPSGDDVKDGFKLENGQPRPLKDRSSRYQWVRTWQIAQ
ncbi:hypothetical protein C2869_04560 [Saccharobesus litoralis]|uniref:GH16 domain-containing protein n=1 Tax=Saccharobesus litoralis TaxID=2172099 RepID=A0A2S0VNG4_9ALTE|nr:family 16 glycosylhydrolase [Saccharobesus litoralis]AWB65753.1 hypothetical protein C2869_04560 [Saccharobesus litoralis]